MEEKRNPRGGRPKAAAQEKRSNHVMLRFTEQEYRKIKEEMDEAGFKKLAEYLRYKLTMRENQLVYNPRRALNELNAIGKEMAAIGKNINQLTRYANYLNLNNMVKPQVVEDHTTQIRKLTEIEIKMQKVIRGFFREGKKYY